MTLGPCVAGVPGGCRAPAVLSAERGQRRPAGRSAHRQQPLQRASVLRRGVKVRGQAPQPHFAPHATLIIAARFQIGGNNEVCAFLQRKTSGSSCGVTLTEESHFVSCIFFLWYSMFYTFYSHKYAFFSLAIKRLYINLLYLSLCYNTIWRLLLHQPNLSSLQRQSHLMTIWVSHKADVYSQALNYTLESCSVGASWCSVEVRSLVGDRKLGLPVPKLQRHLTASPASLCL